MPKLSDTQLTLLSAAAQRADRNLLPLPGSLRGGAATKVVNALLARGLIEEQIVESTDTADPALNTLWRNADRGRGILLRITAAGLDSLGIEADSAAVAAVEASDITRLIQAVFDTLTALGRDEKSAPVEMMPAVPIKRSVTADYIVCLEDGKRLKMLKRHLITAYRMTPEQYRAKRGLPHDYLMVAPSYAAKRQELAKAIGLGRKPAPAPTPDPKLKRGGRKGKVKAA